MQNKKFFVLAFCRWVIRQQAKLDLLPARGTVSEAVRLSEACFERGFGPVCEVKHGAFGPWTTWSTGDYQFFVNIQQKTSGRCHRWFFFRTAVDISNTR